MPNSTLILSGATASSAIDNGIIYDTAGLLDINALSGSGTLVVQSGATVDVGTATSEEIKFSGTNAEAILGTPLVFSGTIAELAQGDTLVLSGLSADTATVVNGNTLAVIFSGNTVDTVALSANYTGATFNATTVGGNAVITNIAGAPPRDDMPFTISLSGSLSLLGTLQSEIVSDLSAAALDWAQYVTGHAPLRIDLNVTSSANGNELASGGPGDLIATGQTINGETLFEANSIYTLVTGNYDPNGTVSDEITINLPASNAALNQLFINPNPFTNPTATQSGKFDLLTIFRHELAHGLGFIGERNTATGVLGPDATMFDIDSQITLSGTTVGSANFIGSNAEAAHGALLKTGPAPVPLTTPQR